MDLSSSNQPIAKYFFVLNTHRFWGRDKNDIDFDYLDWVLSHANQYEWEKFLYIDIALCDTKAQAYSKLNEHSWYKHSHSYMIIKVWVHPTLIEKDAKTEYERCQPPNESPISNLTGRTPHRYAKDLKKQGDLFRSYNIEKAYLVDRSVSERERCIKNYFFRKEMVRTMKPLREEDNKADDSDSDGECN